MGDPLLDGRYRLDRPLVETDARASVYRATRVDDGLLVRVCALQLDATELEPRRQAATRAATFEHPKLPQLLACVTTGERCLWLIYEHVPGPTLTELLAGEPERWRESAVVLELLAGIADALAYLHAHGLAHGGIVAASLSGRGLLDARLEPLASASAPADVSALGWLFAAAASGSQPGSLAPSWRDTIEDGALVALIDRMLAPDPDQRIASQTLREAAHGLLRVRKVSDDRRSPPTLPRASRPTPRFMMLEPPSPSPSPRVGSAGQTSSRTGVTALSRKRDDDVPVMRPEDLSRELSQAYRATAATEERRRKHDIVLRAVVVLLAAIIAGLATYIVLRMTGKL